MASTKVGYFRDVLIFELGGLGIERGGFLSWRGSVVTSVDGMSKFEHPSTSQRERKLKRDSESITVGQV